MSRHSGIVMQTIRVDYATNNVATNAYYQLDAALNGNSRYAEIFDSGGQTMHLAVGASGSEVEVKKIMPGGSGLIPLRLDLGQRLAIKAVSANVSTGELVIDLYY